MNDLTYYTVPLDHPAFAGHFPGTPILPGVVLLDMALQAITHAYGSMFKGLTIKSVKFLSPAQPGDELTIAHKQQDNGTILFDISTATRKIASGSIMIDLSI